MPPQSGLGKEIQNILGLRSPPQADEAVSQLDRFAEEQAVKNNSVALKKSFVLS